MTSSGVSWIFYIRLGGGRRHQLGICAAAIIAAEKGYKVEHMDGYMPGQPGIQPDLIIRKREKTIDGPHRGEKEFRYRVEVNDTHDPAVDIDLAKSGYDDILKIELARADAYCDNGHDLATVRRHPLCVDGLFWICRRSLP